MVRWRWFLCAGLIAGCAAHAGHPTTSPAVDDGPPSTAPAGDAIPLTWTTLKLSDQKLLMKLEGPGESTEFAFKVTPAKADGPIYFGEIQNGDEQLIPIIGTRSGGSYKAVKVSDDWSYDQWSSVLSGPRPSEIWAVLDQTNGENKDDDRQTDDVTLVHSTDAGETFAVATVRKPCRKATFTEFVMSRNGRGRFTLSLAEPCGKLKPGLFHYRTTDGGKTFSRPQYEPDATKPADDVPDEEQPEHGNQSASLPLPHPRYAGGEGRSEGAAVAVERVAVAERFPAKKNPSP